MHDVLGYERFAAQGGDWGAIVTAQLGHKLRRPPRRHPPQLPALIAARPADGRPRTSSGPARRHWYERTRRSAMEVGAPATSPCTRHDPQTLAYALNDSPVGLAAWIVERRRNWSDCGGDVERPLHQGRPADDRDDLLADPDLRHLDALLRRVVRAARGCPPRPPAGGRGADRHRRVPAGARAPAARKLAERTPTSCTGR